MSTVLDTLLTRREAFKVGASLVSAYWFLTLLEPANVHAQSMVTPRGSARFVIFVLLEGGQSHVDSWDLKEHQWTPKNFDIRGSGRWRPGTACTSAPSITSSRHT